MPLINEYKRIFIILAEAEKGYGISGGKAPTGYIKIEANKGKIKVKGTIQNIACNEKSFYKLFLLSSKEEKPVDLGCFRMDSNNKGEITRELVLEKNENIFHYTAALVTSKDVVVLFGCTDKKEVNWESWAKKAHINKAAELHKDPETVLKPIRENKAEEKRQFEITEELKIVEKEVKTIAKEEVQEVRELEDEKDVRREESVEVSSTEISTEQGNREVPNKLGNTVDFDELGKGEATVEISNREEPAEASDHDATIEANTRVVPDGIVTVKEEEETPRDEKVRIIIKEELPFNHPFHVMEEIEADSVYTIPDLRMNNLEKELAEVTKQLKKVDLLDDQANRRWYKIDDKLCLLTPITINLKGIKMSLSYPYFVKGCGPWIKCSVLGIEYKSNIAVKIFIGVPGGNSLKWEPYFNAKGFTKNIKAKDGKEYWMMCIDLDKGMICNI